MKFTLSLFIVILSFASCSENLSKKQSEEIAEDVTEVLYFHTKKRCITCNSIEQLSKEVVDSLANDKIVMSIIDITENETMADKYEVSWSSLLLHRAGKTENLTNMGFSYAKNQPQVFKAKLIEALENIKR